MINRSVTRTIYDTTETTEKTKTTDSLPLSIALTTSQYLYLGYKAPFATRYLYFSTLNTNACTLTVEYYNGTTWSVVQDLVDQTSGGTRSGFISWTNPGNWDAHEQTPVVSSTSQIDLDHYWVRIGTSANWSASTSLQAVLNIFCDDNSLRALYPELTTDTRYLPPGRSDYIEQYLAAKDLVCLRLKQKGVILDESQVIDINEVGIAATHATAFILLNPLATSDETREVARECYKCMDNQLSAVKFVVDQDADGVVTMIDVPKSRTRLTSR